MKRLLKLSLAAIILSAFTINANAQFNAGIDLALPLGDFSNGAGVGFGASIGYEHKIGDNIGVGGELGYLMFTTKSDDLFDDYSSSISMIPILGNFKYYFSENTNGAYGKAAIGMSMYKFSYSYSYETFVIDNSTFPPTLTPVTEKVDDSISKTYLTYGFGGGYLVNEKLDISAEYRIVSGDGGSLAYLNLGFGYNF